jgi:hypothetical protein
VWSGARGPGIFRGASVHSAIQARQEQTPEGTRTFERLQTLVVRKERFLENPELWKNEKAVVPTRNRRPHQLIRAMASPGSAKSIRAYIFFEAPLASRMETE